MNLLKTTAFTLALRFAGLFIIISLVSLTSMYYFTMTEIARQTDSELTHEVGELEAQFYQEGEISLRDLIERRDIYGKHLHHFYAVESKDQTFSGGSKELLLKVNESVIRPNHISFFSSDTTIYDEYGDEILRIAATRLDNGSIVIVGQEQRTLVELRHNTFWAIFIAVVLTFLISIVGGYFVGKYALRVVNQIDRGLAQAINNDFNSLLQMPKEHNEFYALSEKLNLMLVRIHELISSIRHVSDNVAHELRSPLTRMRNRLEVTLLQSRDTEEYRTAMQQAIEDCTDLLQTFNSLLSIARAESGVRKDDWSVLDLATLLDEIAELYTVVAEDAGHELLWQRPDMNYPVTGNRQLLAQMFSNVLENAIKYTPAGETVEVKLEQQRNIFKVSICDSGEGIPEAHRKRVLERFQRLQNHEHISGSGLGLSLVKAVAGLHKAELRLEDNNPGLCVELLFPPASTDNPVSLS